MRYDILPLRTAFFWIIVSTVFISGSAGVSLWLYKWHERLSAADERFSVVAIFQETDAPQPLKSAYLAELLKLSFDRPQNLTTYNLKLAEQRLLFSPHIQSASLKKMLPDTLYVSYVKRLPIARLAEFSDAGIDRDGFLFPFSGYYDSKDVPEFVLGDLEKDPSWGAAVASSNFILAKKLLDLLQPRCVEKKVSVKRIDVSRVSAPSAGQTEIIVTLWSGEDEKAPKIHFLRLGIDHYVQDIENYWRLRKHMAEQDDVYFNLPLSIDLRVPQLAFLSAVH